MHTFVPHLNKLLAIDRTAPHVTCRRSQTSLAPTRGSVFFTLSINNCGIFFAVLQIFKKQTLPLYREQHDAVRS